MRIIVSLSFCLLFLAVACHAELSPCLGEAPSDEHLRPYEMSTSSSPELTPVPRSRESAGRRPPFVGPALSWPDECEGWARVEPPIPPHQFFRSLWGFGDELIGVGDEGIFQRFDGRDWIDLELTYEGNLVGVWAASPNAVFIVGGTRFPEPSGAVLGFDGVVFEMLAPDLPGSLIDIWGTSSSNIFAVGSHGLILHSDGRFWRQLDSGLDDDISGVWGTDERNVYAVARRNVLHFDGTVWSDITWLFGESVALRDVFGFAADDIWFAGSGGSLLHFDGEEVADVPAPTTSRIERLWGAAPDDLYAVGAAGTVLHYDGERWSRVEIEATEDLRAVWGNSDGDVYISGEHATLLRGCGL